MKFRILLFSITTVAIGAAAWYGINGCCDADETTNAYIPRSEFKTVQGIKGAFEYYKEVKSNIYTGEIEAEDFVGMRQAIDAMDKVQGQSKNADVTWANMGPSNVGGRTRAILPFPNDANTLLAGGVSGGIFKSTDAAQSWVRMPDFSQNLCVSSIAMLGNGAIYVGTGNTREGGIDGSGGSGFQGGGLFVSNDQGVSWDLVSDFEPNTFVPSSDWSFINKIVADGSNPDRLWIATDFGLYPYIHGSDELGPLPQGLDDNLVIDLAISADGENIIVATRSNTSASMSVSNDFGATFVEVNDNAPVLPSNFGVVDFDISPSDKDFMVASVSSTSGALFGIYGSKDGGNTWSVMAPAGSPSGFLPFGSNRQGNYDNMITIAPGTNLNGAEEVIMGGIRLYKYTLPENTTPGIFLWEGINSNFSSSPGQAPNSTYVHSDIHTHAWDAEGRLYIGCDGGIFRSSDRGGSWTSLNNNYTTTHYYGIATNPQGQVMGGLQDNGTLWLSLNGATGKQAIQLTGGDGFSCEISQIFPDFMFSTSQEGVIYRSGDGGNSFGDLGDITVASGGLGNDFYTDIALHENSNNQFSQSFVNYVPTLDDPNVDFFAPGIFEVTQNGDTIIGKVPAGTQVIREGKDSEYNVAKVLDEDLNFYSYYVRNIGGNDFVFHNVGDTAKIQEVAQFMMSAALSNGVYVTRQPLKTNGVPQWYKVGASEGTFNNPSSLEFSPDGDHLYVGYRSGKLVRFSGFNNAWTSDELRFNLPTFALTKTTILDAPGSITDIEVDYSQGQGTTGGDPASPKVAVSVGNYGGSGKVRVSAQGATTTTTNTFVDAWNVDSEISGMPCYSIVMDKNNPDIMMVGTEFGIYYTDNNGASWSNSNNGDMNRVPVFDLRQQKRQPWNASNSGVVYAGSHGRGIFKTDYLLDPTTGIDVLDAQLPALSKLKIYPNPVSVNGTVQFDLGVNENVSLAIFSIDGRLIESKTSEKMQPGAKKEIKFNSSALATGTYIVQLKVGDVTQTAKFVKTL